MGENRKLSSFSVLLVSAALAFFGLFSVRGLNLRYTPAPKNESLVVTVSLKDASPAVMEAEITSRLEAVLSGMKACREISSVSSKGYGRVNVELDKGTDVEAARFEASTLIAHLWPSLPEGTSYPVAATNRSGDGGGTLYYLLRSPLSSKYIASFATTHLVYPISSLKGVESVAVYGASPFGWVISFNPQRAEALGISGTDIVSAVQSAGKEDIAGLLSENGRLTAVRLNEALCNNFEDIPVANSAGRIVRLGEIASAQYVETAPSLYMRFNGLNTVTMEVKIAGNANLIRTAASVREEMAALSESFPEEISAQLSYDPSEYVSGELEKILRRAILCLLILLAFSFLINRSLKQMLLLFLSVVTGLLISIGIYRIAGLPIHIYALAGITVSFGIMIDTSLLMADHYARFKDRRAFPAIAAAVATTVAALLSILFLPENDRLGMTDFLWVIVINLTVSLALSYFFIPALMDYLPFTDRSVKAGSKRMRRLALADMRYCRCIGFCRRRRWALAALLLAAFGLPLYLLPDQPGKTDKLQRILGSSSGLFYRNMDRADFYREPERKVLTIHAGMLEGCTVHQLNEVVKSMENYLSSFDEIDNFTTNVRSYDDARIDVRFKPEFEGTSFPSWLKGQVIAMAINFGGANWRVSGVDDNYFNNNIVSDYKSHTITLYGYNYAELTGYAQQLVEILSANRRVSGPEIWGGGWRNRPSTEYHLHYDRESLAKLGSTPAAYYGALSSKLFAMSAGNIMYNGELTDITVVSSEAEDFDLWHVKNVPVQVDSTEISLSGIGDIEARRTGITIDRHNQSYELNVCYDFIGSWQLADKVSAEAVKYMNSKVLPIGYRAEIPGYGCFDKSKTKMLRLILLVILVIYVVLAVFFESLRIPLPIILMIPVSMIGLFLVFGLSSFPFDRGGFAAMVMLCGITVNAGIYLCHTFEDLRRNNPGTRPERLYRKAFRLKIIPISLTLLSTVLGLIPFLSEGPLEVFWFDFAIGTISGLAMSVVALLFYLPSFYIQSK